MTYRDILIMRQNLDSVNAIDGTNPRFTYAVSRNKAKLDSIIKILDGMKKPTAQIEEFWQKLDELNKKHAEMDESGTVIYTTVPVNGEMKKAYKKVIGEGNPTSTYSKEVDKLKKEYKADIDKFDAAIKAYNEHLDTEVPDGDYRKFMIDLEIVPTGLSPRGMDGCLPFIKEPQEDEMPVLEEKESNLKKT